MSNLTFLSFAASALLSSMVLMTKSWHLHRTAKGHNRSSRQSSHKIPTPRIGGIGLLAFVFSGYLVENTEVQRIILMLSISALPVFVGGFGEDVGYDIKPKARLFLSFVSAMIAGTLLDTWLRYTGVPGLDFAISYIALAVPFTVIVSGGICHSLNLVDGLNGLSLGISIISISALAYIAALAGDPVILAVCLILLGSVLGIFVLNFPFGKIFLGDAGAYTIGHLLTWCALLLMSRNPEVAPFAMLLVFFWPVSEMLFSIFRRIRSGQPVDQPDRMHFHQFVMRAIELTFKVRRSVANPLAASTIWPFSCVAAIFAIRFYSSNTAAAISCAICFVAFVWSYVFGVRLARFLARARKGDENIWFTMRREGFRKIRRAAAGKKSFPAE